MIRHLDIVGNTTRLDPHTNGISSDWSTFDDVPGLLHYQSVVRGTKTVRQTFINGKTFVGDGRKQNERRASSTGYSFRNHKRTQDTEVPLKSVSPWGRPLLPSAIHKETEEKISNGI